MIRSNLAALLLAAAVSAQQAPSPAQLLADLADVSNQPASSMPALFTSVGASVFFVADDGVHGVELYRSLGAPHTTALVLDIQPGSNGSGPAQLVALGDRLVFTADDGVHGRELWISDGTAAGTQLVTDLVPGPNSISVGQAVALGDKLFIDILEPAGGFEPWVTDGTAAGTMRLADITPGAGGSRGATQFSFAVVRTTVTGRELLFTAKTPTAFTIWRTDGTPAGTSPTGISLPTNLIYVTGPQSLPNGRVTFGAFPSLAVGATTADVWSTDGTPAGTFIVKSDAGIGTFLSQSGRAGDVAVYPGSTTVAATLTDGTLAGTRTIGATGGVSIGSMRFLGEIAGSLYGVGADATSTALYRIDANSVEAARVGPFPYTFDGGRLSQPRMAGAVGGRLIVSARSGTAVVLAVDPTTADATVVAAGSSVTNRGLGIAFGRAWFAGFDTNVGVEPMISNGTVLGTSVLTDVNPGTASAGITDSSPFGFARIGDRTVFFAQLQDGPALMATDGRATGTQPIVRGQFLQFRSQTCVVGSRFFFVASTAADGFRLYVSEGTAATTHMVQNTNGWNPTVRFDELVALRNEVLFVGDAPTGSSLYASDGTTLREVAPLAATTSYDVRMRRLGDEVLLRSMRNNGGADTILATDGTAAGTRLVANATYTGTPTLEVWRGRAWFVSRGASSDELFVTDGTIAGTGSVGSVGPLVAFTGGSRADFLIPTPERLWIAGSAGIWYVDGVGDAPNPVLGLGIRPWITAAPPAGIGTRLVFDAIDASSRFVVAVTDGDGAATTLSTGSRGVYLENGFVPLGNRFVLFAMDGSLGAARTLWVTDGTPAGTRLLQPLDLRVTTNALDDPTPCAHVANGLVYLAARDSAAGIEPFVLDPGAISETVGTGCGGVGRSASLTAMSDPILGRSAELVGRASPGHAAVMLFSASAPTATLLPFAGACALEVDPSFVAIPGLTVQLGVFRYALAIPDVPTLAGLSCTLQAVVGPTDGIAGFDLTNGVRWTLGR